MTTGDNDKYGRMISDGRYIHNIIEELQEEIDQHDDWTHDGTAEYVSDKLDELEIYPDDIDYIFAELNF